MRSEDLMYRAITRDDIETVREVILSDTEVIQTFPMGISWLHLAARENRTDIVMVLLQFGLKADQFSSDGKTTPLQAAAAAGKYEACETLLKNGADINLGFGEKATPIFSAIFGKSESVVRLFVSHGADLNATFGTPAISIIGYAEKFGTGEIVKFLRTAINDS